MPCSSVPDLRQSVDSTVDAVAHLAAFGSTIRVNKTKLQGKRQSHGFMSTLPVSDLTYSNWSPLPHATDREARRDPCDRQTDWYGEFNVDMQLQGVVPKWYLEACPSLPEVHTTKLAWNPF